MDVKDFSVWWIKIPHIIIFIMSCLSLAFAGTYDSHYMGCYEEFFNSYKWTRNIDLMTNSWCIEYCKKLGIYTHASTIYSMQCSCVNAGTIYDFIEKEKARENGDPTRDPGNCSAPCAGNKDEKCGAPSGFFINSVYRVCPKRKFGSGCAEDCHCGEEGMCNPLNGSCSGDKKTCQKGWTNWPECQSSCIQGPNDLNCTGECHCLTGVPCDHNGECDQSKGRRCAVGYASKGFPKCDIKCDPGTYGDDCKKNCPSCRHRGCDPTDGTCQSCPAGYKGIKCQEFCEDGYYGFDCMKRCKGHCANVTCSPEDGSCPGGCLDGYEGTRCDKPSKATTMKGEIAVVIIGIASLAILLIEDLGC